MLPTVELRMSSSKAVLLFVISVSIVGFCLGKDQPFFWEDCGKSGRTFIIKNVDLEPKPITFRRQTTLQLSGAIEAKEDLTSDVKITIKVTRMGSFWGALNIPVFYKTHNFCDCLKDPKLGPLFCNILTAAGQKCECPIPKGSYSVSKAPTYINLDFLPSLLRAGALRYGTGNWMLEIWAYRGKQEMGCFRVKTHLKTQF